jgi:mRNA interferase MazF
MTNLERGDVVLVWFPNSDLAGVKKRPALVVQADDLGTGLAQLVLVMITSNLDRRGHPSRVFITLNSSAAKAGGLRTDSVIMTDNLSTVLMSAIAAKVGRLSDMREVDNALRLTLAL